MAQIALEQQAKHAKQRAGHLQEVNHSLAAERAALSQQLTQRSMGEAGAAQEAAWSLEQACAAAEQLQAHNAQLLAEREHLLQALTAAQQRQQVRVTSGQFSSASSGTFSPLLTILHFCLLDAVHPFE